MKLVIEKQTDFHRIVDLYSDNLITAEEYFDAVDQWAVLVVDKEIRAARRRK